MHSSQPQRLFGLGVSPGYGSPNRKSAPAPLSPTPRAPFASETDDSNPPSPAPYDTPGRFRITNPDPPAEEDGKALNNLQAQASRSFALKPTHTARPVSSAFAAINSTLAPHSPQAPSDPFSKPLATLDNNDPNFSQPGQNSTPDKLLPNNGNGAIVSSRQTRPSKSSEFLRRLRSGSEPPSNTTPYQALSDDEDEDERLRLPRNTLRATNSHARTIEPQSRWSDSTGSHASQFPLPPHRTPGSSAENSGSAETYATAKNGRPNSNASAESQKPARPRSQPWPMAAKAGPAAPTTSTALGAHSQNAALLAAETGGMVVLDNASRRYSPGEGPGQVVSQMPNYAQVPSASRHAHRKSTGDINFRYQTILEESPRPPDFSQARLPITPPSSDDGADLRRRGHVRANSDGIALLARQGTLFHPASSDARASQELEVMLGKPKSRRLSANAVLPAPETPKQREVRLEASKKSRARVELDVVIERECVVEGGELRGRLEVVVRGGKRGNGLRVGAGKLRVLGYEEVVEGSGTNRHIFYQHQYLLPEFFEHDSPPTTLFASGADEEGFRLAHEGTHALPFSMQLPLGGGAKGAFTGDKSKGPNIRYVVVGSVKLHIPKSGKRAIAHFYRPMVLLPYHNPARVLAPSRQPLVEFIESRLGWSLTGEKGKVFLQVSLGRQTWVAGQRVWCEVGVRNNSNKKITRCSLAILQTVNTFGVPKVKGTQDFLNMIRRKVSEETNEADFMDVGSGHVTSKSWWTGLEPGESNRWDMSVPIPTGMISIPRSKLVEISYVLRVTLNNSIFVDVPIELINFLSVDPPPMPSDARRARVRMAVAGPAGALRSGVASTLFPPVPETPPLLMQASSQQPQPRELQSHQDAPPTRLPGVPEDGGFGYTFEQLKGEPQGNQPIARSSSTTLDIEALVAQGRARSGAEYASSSGDSMHSTGHLRVPDEHNTDMMPRPISPMSKYSSVGTAVPGSAMSTIRGRRGSNASETESIDEEERNRLVVEGHRRDGRVHALAVIGNGTSEHLDAATEGDVRDDASVIHSSLEPHEVQTYRPAEEPNGPRYEFDTASIYSQADGLERSGAPTPHIEQTESLADTDNEQTPMGSPTGSPVTSPVVHPISKFLHHISEEEEPLTDDMLDDMVSLDGGVAGGYLQGSGGSGDDDDDDLVAADISGEDVTPRGSAFGRASLEQRLALACGGGAIVTKAQTAVAAEAREFSPQLNKRGDFSPVPLQQEFGARPDSIDYAMPLEIGDLSITSKASTEPDDGYDATSEHSSTVSRSPRGHRSTHSLPGGWSPHPSTYAEAPMLPPPSSARDISWGGNLAGRTVSGHTAMISLDDSPVTPASATFTPASATFGTPGPSPRSATFGTQIPYPPPPQEYERDREGSSTPNGRQAALFAATAGLTHEDLSDEDLEPPNILRRVDTGGADSFHTAQSDGEDIPQLKRSSDSDSSDDLLESPPIVNQPLYTTPLPAPPGPSPRTSRIIPDRFRPTQTAPPPPPMSEESHISTASSSHESGILPAVKARVAQFEHREEALRRFTVNSSAGLQSPTTGLAPLSPAHTSSGSSGSHGNHGYTSSPSGRRSYTSALGSRVPGGFGSPRSQASFNLETPQTAAGEFVPAQFTGTTSSISSVRQTWHMREQEDNAKGLLRQLSNASNSTTATDIERVLTRSPVTTPRGPRPPSHKAAIFSSISSRDNRESGSTLSMDASDLGPPIHPPTYRGSPALTPTREKVFLPEVMSETASLAEVQSYDSHRAHSEEGVSSSSEFGTTHWTGGPARLPPLRQARQPLPMPAFGPNGPSQGYGV
ncbi:hypothetical protein CC85DRAFT_265886 [Cutaneotrichosporon oleaginosum]|uniref:Arrestin C-terminal-like domain-containing protein n=1 Tax=Cutaneotrichosporon oleaginosum TaxID=879819 RepID=A0A0J0XDN0_9TREE|nr:uncharacterized protein CC85DRAFT_265886 [Cutaneotrichosporon oleaginosum]KLT39172.1 hypothetical protein CC85DRAFT_265886 [Cutaneotrichosporon oleaginosum]TXT05310.1 hypothetical protein COLE_06630 [Cutaneotrichosporon oleaginosum]